MITINNSTGKPNWSQLKNHDEPLSTCNVTAAINASQASGYDVLALRKSKDPNIRPADDLYEFLHIDSDCLALWTQLDPHHAIPPNQWMPVLALGLGKWLGNPVLSEFHESLPLEILASHIYAGDNIVVSGHYPAIESKGPTSIDHITALIGVSLMSISPIVIDHFIMDDSYGDYRTKYVSKVGDDIPMSLIDAKTLLKPIDNAHFKRGIIVRKKGS